MQFKTFPQILDYYIESKVNITKKQGQNSCTSIRNTK